MRKRKGKFIERLKAFIERMKSKFNNFLEEHVDTALKITTTIKGIVDNPVTNILVKLTPTDKDDKALAVVRAALNVAVTKLAILQKCNDNEELEDKIRCWIDEIRKQPADVQNALLVKFGALVAAHLDGNKEAQHIYDTAVQSVYSISKENNA